MSESNVPQVMPQSNTTELMTFRDPKTVLVEAQKAAFALRDLITKKKDPVIFNKQQYLEYEDWQLLGQFCGGIKAKVTWTRFLDFGGGVKGFEAGSDAIDAEGRIISSAEAMCLNDEENWSTRPKYEYMDTADAEKRGLKIIKKYDKGRCSVKVADVPVPMFQLRSMAQTRACAKALNNCLRWVAVLADFAPTPAEEMTGERDHEEKPTIKPPQQKSEAPKQTNSDAPEKPAGSLLYIFNAKPITFKDKETGEEKLRYEIMFENDKNKYGTFSESDFDAASTAQSEDLGVTADLIQNGKYWNVKNIQVIPNSRRPEPEPTAPI